MGLLFQSLAGFGAGAYMVLGALACLLALITLFGNPEESPSQNPVYYWFWGLNALVLGVLVLLGYLALSTAISSESPENILAAAIRINKWGTAALVMIPIADIAGMIAFSLWWRGPEDTASPDEQDPPDTGPSD